MRGNGTKNTVSCATSWSQVCDGNRENSPTLGFRSWALRTHRHIEFTQTMIRAPLAESQYLKPRVWRLFWLFLQQHRSVDPRPRVAHKRIKNFIENSLKNCPIVFPDRSSHCKGCIDRLFSIFLQFKIREVKSKHCYKGAENSVFLSRNYDTARANWCSHVITSKLIK